MKRICLLMASVALALCACNKVDHPEGDEKEAPLVYHLNIQASMDPQTKGVTFGTDGESITSQFKAGDKVYVYNKTQGALARHWDDGESSYLATPIVLSSDDIQNEGRSCTLKGDLAFYKLNDSDEWENVAVTAEDMYDLFYLMNDPDYSFANTNYYPRNDYSLQDGSADTASQCDFAEATGINMDMAGSTLTVPGSVKFTNLQSMFRQKLTFKNAGDETVTPTIKRLSIDTEKGTLVYYFKPTFDSSSRFEQYSIEIDDPVISDGNIYLALAFYYPDDASKTDKLILTATDTEKNVYRCAKDVPAGGFQNGKYYHGDCIMVWDHQMGKPKVTYSDSGVPYESGPNADGWYDFYGNPMKFTIYGDSQGYRFYFNDYPGYVTLTGSGDPVSASWAGHNAFIESEDDLTVILDCNYIIDNSANYEKAIDCGGVLKLKTTGGTQTLTVITNDDGSFAYGIYGDSNFDAWMYDFSNIDNLAADGFSVSCPGAVDNLDGTYTWVYTVTPTP